MVEIVGKYRSGNKWKFSSLTTETNGNIYAVAGIVFRGKKYLITKNKRGWEIPAGHIELGETQVEALEREVMEEVGAKVISSKLIGYQKYKLEKVKKLPNKTLDIGTDVYLPVYICESEDTVYKPTGEEIFDYKEKDIMSVDNEKDLFDGNVELIKFAIKKRGK